jgi:hypothetical protein
LRQIAKGSSGGGGSSSSSSSAMGLHQPGSQHSLASRSAELMQQAQQGVLALVQLWLHPGSEQ